MQAKISSGNCFNDIEIMNVLIARKEEIGLNFNHRDDNGATALDILALSNFEFVDEKVVLKDSMNYIENLDPTKEKGCRNYQKTKKRCIIL